MRGLVSCDRRAIREKIEAKPIGLQRLMGDLRSGSSLQILSLWDADSSKYQISCQTLYGFTFTV